MRSAKICHGVRLTCSLRSSVRCWQKGGRIRINYKLASPLGSSLEWVSQLEQYG